MKKYAKVVDELTKECEVGIGDDYNFYQELGMSEMSVEQAYNSKWYVEGYAPVQPVEEQNERIRQTRASLYATLVDPLHAEKQRKVVMGVWTEADETNYVAEVTRLTEQIQTENPYIEL